MARVRQSSCRAGTARPEIRRAWLAALALAAPCAVGQPASPDLQRAEALIRDGKAQEAWQLLAPFEAQHAGRLEYDYLLGVAALESGKPGRATFILERVLIANPGHTAARLEMARAYFALGDRERSAREFRAVLAMAPPAATRATVQQYLARLEGGATGAPRAFQGYVEATVGRDSNVNAAAILASQLSPLALSASEADGYFGIGAGAALSSELDRTYTVFGGADVRSRMHFDLDQFDSLEADLRVGVQARVSPDDHLRLTLEHNEYDLDNDGLRRTQGASAQWIRRLEPQAQVTFYAQALRIRYRQEALTSENSDLMLAGLQVSRAFGSLIASASAYAGRDDATGGRADGDRELAGLGGTLERPLSTRVQAYARVSYQHSDYRRDNTMIGAQREDRYTSVDLGLDWRVAPGWIVRPHLSREQNRSNLPATEYGRTEASISLRRIWD